MDLQANHQDDFKIRSTDRFDPHSLKTDETIFSLANGRLGVRGNFAEGYGERDVSPVFLNGFYNYYPFHYEENYSQFPQRGQTIVPLPDPTSMEVWTEEGPIHKASAELIALDRTLDMMQGGTVRTCSYRTLRGNQFTITEERRMASTTNLFIQKLTVTSPDYSGILLLKSSLTMPYVPPLDVRDPRLSRPKDHLRLTSLRSIDDCGILCAVTTSSNLAVCIGVAHDVPVAMEATEDGLIGILRVTLSANQTFSWTKYTAVASSNVETDPFETVRSLLYQRVPMAIYAQAELKKNQRFWETSDVELGTLELTRATRYNLYQLDHSGGQDSQHSIAAKGISGDGYEGHYFWDTETYMLPFFLLTNPPKARNLLTFRHAHLPQARIEARNLGVSRGAKIPWRTIDGTETSPYYPAGSAQIHINSDVALAVIHYFHATNDEPFLLTIGAELILETAIFLYDWGHYRDGKFHLDCVTGPDEYSALVNDNHYTNQMAKRHFLLGSKLLFERKDRLNPLIRRLGYTWEDVSALALAGEQMALWKDETNNLWMQDQHFNQKKELDLSGIPNHEFPLLLHRHPLAIYRHQVLKQADTVLSMVLSFDPVDDCYRNTVAYYRKRTTHDSSLSKCAYGIASFQLDNPVEGLVDLNDVARLDLEDKKHHTRHGLHCANMGGNYLMVAYGIFGIELGEELAIRPKPIAGWKKAVMRLQYQGTLIVLTLETHQLRITVDRPLPLWIDGRRIVVESSLTLKSSH
jgi:alpha,alpha-trehalose phosphorylase